MSEEMTPISEVPAKKDNKKLIIGVVIALVLCCCCVVVAGVYFGYDSIVGYLNF